MDKRNTEKDVLFLSVPAGFTVTAYPLSEPWFTSDWFIVLCGISMNAWEKLDRRLRDALTNDAIRRATQERREGNES